ncbi:MAG: sodium:calcium antiporter, partial [Bacteroidales bacterium]|nr:sodium:calcium antiporter [Candidatus Sodaliphilus fimicaballi]
RETQRRDIPLGIAAAVLVIALASDSIIPGISENTVSRIDGIFLLIVFFAYMCYVVVLKGRNPQQALADADEQTQSRFTGKNPVLLGFIAVASLAGLIFGGNLFLNSAKTLARTWGMSEAVISITIVAIGTSLPELITVIVAASKKNAQLALGNVLGSNVFNLLMILGVSSTIKPITVVGVTIVDFLVLLLGAVLTYVVIFTFGKHKFDRIEGFIFIAIYIGYTISLLLR